MKGCIYIALTLFVAANLYSQNIDIGKGLLDDKDPHPMTPLAKPGYLQTVTDPEFGTTIRRITDIASEISGENAVIKPMYSTIQAWNADESLLILWQRGRGHLLFDGKTYAFVRELDINPSDLEHVIWHATDPDILFYPESVNLSGSWVEQLILYHVSTGTKEVVRDFSNDGVTGYHFGFGSDPMYSSWDSNVFGLTASENNPNMFTFCISDNTINATIANKNYGEAPMPSPDGTLFYYHGKVYNSNLIEVVDLGLGNSSEHASIGQLANGLQKYFCVQFNPGPNSPVGTLMMHDMQDGSYKVLVGESNGYPYPPSGTHICALATKAPGWVAVSIIGFDEDGQDVLDNEILLVNANEGEERVYRVAHHRSRRNNSPFGYWAEPHVVISPTGTRILFGSDWHEDTSVETFVVELPSYQHPTTITSRPASPAGFNLKQNFPNPFNPITVINYELAKSNWTTLAVCDVLGTELKTLVNEYKNAGTYKITFDAANFPSGVYFYKLTSGDFSKTKKMVLLR